MSWFKVDLDDAFPAPTVLPPTDTTYHYGYPAYGRYEPGVVAQWLLEETSGGIVDEVNGLTLSPTGDPTYSVSATGQWVNVSPGITNNINSYFSITID